MSSEQTFQARVVGALALWVCVLGCGGRVGVESENSGPSSAAPRANPTFVPPPSAAPTAPRPARPMVMSPSVPPEPRTPPQAPNSIDGQLGDALAQAAAENILSINCGVCHGELAEPATSGGILFIGDVDALVSAGLIVPLNSAGSRIIQVMRDGSMPPPASGYPAMTDADLEVVTAFIDNPLKWPAYAPPLLDAGIATPPPVPDGGSPAAVEPGADAG